MATVQEMLTEAKAHHGAGRLHEALSLYQRVLQADPACAEGYSLQAAVCHALGRPQDAVASLRAALQLNPDSAETHNFLGVLLTAVLPEMFVPLKLTVLAAPGVKPASPLPLVLTDQFVAAPSEVLAYQLVFVAPFQ